MLCSKDNPSLQETCSPEATARFKQARARLHDSTIPQLIKLLESHSLNERFHAEMRLREVTST